MKATNEELRDLLKKDLRAKSRPPTPPASPPQKSTKSPPPQLNPNAPYEEDPTGTAFEFESPLHLLGVLRPEFDAYSWQAETLLQLGGFLDPCDLTKRTKPTAQDPFKLLLPAANGSGKDMVIIAAFAVWFAMKGLKNKFVCTSASYEQLKYQTEVHIKDLIKEVNKKFGKIFQSVEFYHVCTQTASEIKLFVTDEAGRAEGSHPMPGGEMAICINEAKSVPEQIFDALDRCTGYNYWLEVSSPAGKSGTFYQNSLTAVRYPELPQLGKFFLRHVSAYDCPHIPLSHIEAMKVKKTKSWFDSSVLALFSDVEDENVITEELFDNSCKIENVLSVDDTIGIGGDLSAGGDELAFYVRRGPDIIKRFFFQQTDTTVSVEIINRNLEPYKDLHYVANMDDGGIGHAIIDGLAKYGWHINRIHNQAAARDKRQFLNKGAEMYWHLQRLLHNKQHRPKNDDPILRRQLTTRLCEQKQTGGKLRLEDKKLHISRNKESPDRADAYVLCFYSMPIELKRHESRVKPARLSLEAFRDWFENLKGDPNNGKSTSDRPTCIVKV